MNESENPTNEGVLKSSLFSVWPITCAAIFISGFLVQFICSNYISLFPQNIVSAKVTDFHYTHSGKQDFYFMVYEYDLNGKKHLEHITDYAVARGSKHPEEGIYPSVMVNVSGDAQGNYKSTLRSETPLAWFITLLFGIICLSLWTKVIHRIRNSIPST